MLTGCQTGLGFRSDQRMDRQTRIYLFEALSTATQGTGQGWVGQCWSKAGGLVAKEGPMRGRDSLTDTRTGVGPTQAGQDLLAGPRYRWAKSLGPWERKESKAGGRDRWQGPGHMQMRTVKQTGPNHQAVCEVCSINHKELLAKVFPCLRVSHLSFFYPKTLPLHSSHQSFPPVPPAPPPSPSPRVQTKQNEASTTICDTPAGPQSPKEWHGV